MRELGEVFQFTLKLWKSLEEYLRKYSVAGQNLKVVPLDRVFYHEYVLGIAIVDADGRPQLIIVTSRNPLERYSIARALCFATLALKHHNLDKTPLFATANDRIMILFRGIKKEKLEKLVDITKCMERHIFGEEGGSALKPCAYSSLLREYFLARLEKPLSDETIIRLFEIYKVEWIAETRVTPAPLYNRIVIQSVPYEKHIMDLIKELENHQLMVRVGEWFKSSRGNSIWSIWALDHGRRPDLGAEEFFYFSRNKVDFWNSKVPYFRDVIEEYLVPAIKASRYVRTFVFTEEDWRPSWILVLHERRDALPWQIEEYIRWGETWCSTGIGGRICSKAEACKSREEAGEPYFYGWYDLGGYIPTPIMAVRRSGYHPQFFLVSMLNLVADDDIIALIPRVKVRIGGITYDPEEYNVKYSYVIDSVKSNIKLDEVEIKALLAYLNSTFSWLWLEQNARYTARGSIVLDVDVVDKMPVLNVKKIDRSIVEELAKLFDKLEFTTRSIVETRRITIKESEKPEIFKEVREVFRKIDTKVSEILEISIDVDELWSYAREMMEMMRERAACHTDFVLYTLTSLVEDEIIRRYKRKFGGDKERHGQQNRKVNGSQRRRREHDEPYSEGS